MLQAPLQKLCVYYGHDYHLSAIAYVGLALDVTPYFRHLNKHTPL